MGVCVIERTVERIGKNVSSLAAGCRAWGNLKLDAGSGGRRGLTLRKLLRNEKARNLVVSAENNADGKEITVASAFVERPDGSEEGGNLTWKLVVSWIHVCESVIVRALNVIPIDSAGNWLRMS